MGAKKNPPLFSDVTAKSRHPREGGDPCLFNRLKRMDSCFRRNDTQDLSQLFAVVSSQGGGRLFPLTSFHDQLERTAHRPKPTAAKQMRIRTGQRMTVECRLQYRECFPRIAEAFPSGRRE